MGFQLKYLLTFYLKAFWCDFSSSLMCVRPATVRANLKIYKCCQHFYFPRSNKFCNPTSIETLAVRFFPPPLFKQLCFPRMHQAGLPAPPCCKPSTTTPAATPAPGSPVPGATRTHKPATEPQPTTSVFQRKRRGADHLSAERISWGSTLCCHWQVQTKGKHHDESPHLIVQTADDLPRTLPCPTQGSSSFNSSYSFFPFKFTKSHI